MIVTIDQFLEGIKLGNNGIKFEVRDPSGKPLKGYCTLKKGSVQWRHERENGQLVTISWDDFIEIMKSTKSKNAAVKAAKGV